MTRHFQHMTTAKARHLLEQSAPFLETSFASGARYPGRLNELRVTTETASREACRSRKERPQLRYGIHPSPFGPALLALSAKGICRLDFFDDDGADTLEQLRKDWPHAELIADNKATATPFRDIFTPLQNKPPKLLLHLCGTDFQLKVWQVLLQIPPGCLASYQRIAEQIGQPTAARAVGHAIGRNPICYLVPCHRVVRGDGSIGGYRSGIQRKQMMLAAEK